MGVIFHPSLMGFASVCFDLCAEPVPNMSVVNSTKIGAGSTLRFPPPHPVDEYIHRWSSRLDVRWSAFFQKVRR